MTPSHAAKGSLRYRYYVSVDEQGDQRSRHARRIAAGDIESDIVTGLKALLDDQPALIELLGAVVAGAEAASAITVAARLLRAPAAPAGVVPASSIIVLSRWSKHNRDGLFFRCQLN